MGVALALAATLACGAATAQATITVTSFGGTYGKSQFESMHKPFAAATGVKVLSEDYNGGLAQVRAQVRTGNVKWDVIDVEAAEAIRGCDEGLFERIDPAILPAGVDGKAASEDFFDGGIMECAVRNEKQSFVAIWDGQIQVSDHFASVKGSRNLAASVEFVKFATGSQPLVDQAKFVAYAPGRKSSIPLVDPAVREWLPNAGHPGRMLVSNAEW